MPMTYRDNLARVAAEADPPDCDVRAALALFVLQAPANVLPLLARAVLALEQGDQLEERGPLAVPEGR